MTNRNGQLSPEGSEYAPGIVSIESAPVASFHLIHYRGRSTVNGLGRWYFDLPALRRVPGMRSGRLMATSIGAPRRPNPFPVPHLRRVALIAAWDNHAALDNFIHGSPIARRWRQHAKETYHLRLEPCSWRGTWREVDPWLGFAHHAAPTGPAAVFTFGTLHLRAIPPFYRRQPGTFRDVSEQPGLLAVVPLSDTVRPYWTVSTFSLWRSLDEALEFAYVRVPHNSARGLSVERDWFADTSFTRFRPLVSEGTWGGTNPLAQFALQRAPAG